jgi:glycosyltransferase involved in cell wall biosynthesis
MNYQELLRACVLAIPLVANTSLAGLTSLMDALGTGKLVIMTRHPLIDIDIEKEGIGKWVEPGDIEGWTRALSFFHRHPEESQAMGLRARALVDNGLNSSSFADQVMDLFEQLLP